MLFCIKKWPSRFPSSRRCSQAQEGTRRLVSRVPLAMLPRPQVGGSWAGFSAPRQHCRAVCSRHGTGKWAKPKGGVPKGSDCRPLSPGGGRRASPALVAVPPWGCCHAGWETRGEVPRSGGSCSVLGPEQILFVSGFFLVGACRPLECHLMRRLPSDSRRPRSRTGLGRCQSYCPVPRCSTSGNQLASMWGRKGPVALG